MKAVILAGGVGSRISEETVLKPKPLVEIGGRPILWHIMKIYSSYGINEFVVCLGYKGHMIKEYFANYYLRSSDVTIDTQEKTMDVHASNTEPWRVTLIDTGENSGTGGRLKRVIPHVSDEESFCLTYGDGVGDIDLGKLIDFHQAHGKLATVTATRPIPRFGIMHLDGDKVSRYDEKPHGEQDWVNGGFFVLSPKIGEFIDGDETYWEQEPMRKLVELNELQAYRHDGFWQPMDSLSDRRRLESHWETDAPPWKSW